MVAENINKGFRLKNASDSTNYIMEEIEQNELVINKPLNSLLKLQGISNTFLF